MNAEYIPRIGLPLAVSVVLLLTPMANFSTSASVNPSYVVIDLSNGFGGKRVARGISENGQVVGRSGSLIETGTRAVAWTDGEMQELGTLPGGDFSAASKVNSKGEVVGASNTANALHAFVWTTQAGMKDLGTLPGDTSSEALDINDGGQVVGYSSGPVGMRAVLWTIGEGVQNLGTLSGGDYSKAVSLNRAGQVVGVSGTSAGSHAFLWTSGNGLQDLGTLPGDETSEALDINDSGAVVGYSRGPNGMRAFLWTSDKGMQSLGTLTGGSNSKALAINNSGVVVGSSSSSLGTAAVVWSSIGGVQDLNQLIPTNVNSHLLEALSINDNDTIVAIGKNWEESPSRAHNPKHDNHQGPTNLFLLIPIGSPVAAQWLK